MLPRGEVGLIFATIGLRESVLDGDLYAALLLVVLCTTLAGAAACCAGGSSSCAPARTPAASEHGAAPHGRLARGRRRRASTSPAQPPRGSALSIALEAALAIAGRQPAPRPALARLARRRSATRRCDGTAMRRPGSSRCSREGDDRAWRFLEASGVLERALPELAEAVRRRRADPFVVDPRHVLRFELVDAIRDAGGHRRPRAAEYAASRASRSGCCSPRSSSTPPGEDSAPVDLARRLVQAPRPRRRGRAGDRAARRRLGPAAGRRGTSRGPRRGAVLELATHLERPERARALYLLTLALGEARAVGTRAGSTSCSMSCWRCSSSPSSRGSRPETWSSGGAPKRCAWPTAAGPSRSRIAARAARVPAGSGSRPTWHDRPRCSSRLPGRARGPASRVYSFADRRARPTCDGATGASRSRHVTVRACSATVSGVLRDVGSRASRRR